MGVFGTIKIDKPKCKCGAVIEMWQQLCEDCWKEIQPISRKEAMDYIDNQLQPLIERIEKLEATIKCNCTTSSTLKKVRER
jgi:hypothetical protein